MNYKPPIIKEITIKGKMPRICNAVLATDSMQLPGFLSLEAEVNGKKATRFVALDAIEEMTIENGELYKTMPCSFVPETRLKARIDGTI